MGENAEPMATPSAARARLALAAWLLAFALVSRITVFGDTNYFNDEYFYFQGGLRLWVGDLPYVDVWDRKGPGLFLTYALAGAVSSSVIAYQTLALLFAAATALCVSAIARRFTTPAGAALGGTLYLVLLVFFGGGGGQSPVFYNLWMALAALGVLRALSALDRGEASPALYVAMAAAGFALTFKQTAIAECLHQARRSLQRRPGGPDRQGIYRLLRQFRVCLCQGGSPAGNRPRQQPGGLCAPGRACTPRLCAAHQPQRQQPNP